MQNNTDVWSIKSIWLCLKQTASTYVLELLQVLSIKVFIEVLSIECSHVVMMAGKPIK